MNPGDTSRRDQNSRRPLLSYKVITFALVPLLVASLLACASVGFYFGAPVAGIVFLLFAALNAVRLVLLIRIGEKGWNARFRQGR